MLKKPVYVTGSKRVKMSLNSPKSGLNRISAISNSGKTSSLLLMLSFMVCNWNLILDALRVETKKMKFRKKMGNKHSQKYFSKTAGAQHVHPKNAVALPMRGGIRL